MDRRTLVTAVGAAALTLAAAAVAVAVNLGILDDPGSGPGDRFVQSTSGGATGATGVDASGATDEPEVVRIQVRDLPPTGSTTIPATGGTPAAPAATAAPASAGAAAGAAVDDDHDDEHDDRRGARPGGRARERHDDDD